MITTTVLLYHSNITQTNTEHSTTARRLQHS
nr:MAG TPA_asm: hypothetical protein [Caudoviricetes sp.]